MNLVCFGINHQTAPMALLGQVSVSHTRIERLLSDLAGEPAVAEVLCLSTCNRLEVYMATAHPETACEAVLQHLAGLVGFDDIPALRRAFHLHLDAAAAEHLFRVAAGIDSMIIGEAQILGQVGKAFDLARSLGTSGEFLNSLLQRAIAFGRRVRMETGIGRGNLSVASVACRMAVEQMQSLGDKELLILGAGETAQLAGRHFAKEKIGKLRILNRTIEHARAITDELGGEAVPIDQLQSAIASADIVVCAVGAPHVIITREGVAATMTHRPNRPLLLIDLSMPCNIDPAAANLPGVTLHSMESLQEIARENRANRECEIVHVEKMVKKETNSFLEWAASSTQNQLVTTLRRHVADIRQRALDRFFKNENPELLEQLDRFTDSVVRAVLHDATQYIRGLNLDNQRDLQDFETIKRLFALDGASIEEIHEAANEERFNGLVAADSLDS